MTPQEHGLVMGLYAKQLQLIKALTTILESRAVLEKDDMKAFHALMESDVPAAKEIVAQAYETYQSLARAFHIHTGV
jgi:hypothetical protein